MHHGHTLWWPFSITSEYGRGQVLHTPVVAPVYDAKNRDAVPIIKSVSILANTKAGPALHIFVINREPSGAPVDVAISIKGCNLAPTLVHHCIHHEDLRTENSAANPMAVMPSETTLNVASDGKLSVRLQGWSWNLFRVGVNSKSC